MADTVVIFLAMSLSKMGYLMSVLACFVTDIPNQVLEILSDFCIITILFHVHYVYYKRNMADHL